AFPLRVHLHVGAVGAVLETNVPPLHRVAPEILALRIESVERAGALALRIARAAQEPPEPVPAHQHRAAALLTHLALGGEDLLDDLVRVRLAGLDPLEQARIEAGEQAPPLDLALFHAVELALHAARERHIEDVREE